ncbi:MAG TPA: class I SAM-dependent methyltransferase [Thermoanaerobaculia bacterium]|nr:class I SAM-dependent methyltransferase [Thermoanaerobaculia bacterium]
MKLKEWNARYRSREQIDNEPSQLLLDAARDLTPGRALDLACGAGRNAAWLAEHGWDVVAIDGAEEAIRLVHEKDARIDARVMDLESNAPLPFDDETFDLVAILYFLHRPLFAEARRVLRPGGLLVTAIRSRGINPRFCLSLDELLVEFAGMDVLHTAKGEITEAIARN